MEAQIIRTSKYVRTERINGHKSVIRSLLIALFNVSNLLNCLDQ